MKIKSAIESGARRKLLRLYLLVMLGAAVLYVVSCAPGSLWQDSGTIQYRVWHNDIEGGMGLALAHPLFYILAIGIKYVPLGEFAFRVNLVAAIAAAAAVANVFLLVRLWVGKNLPGFVAAVTFALSHTFWRHASIAETYTLYIAIFTAELIMLLLYAQSRRVGYLYWLGLLNGLAVANHMLGSIPLACYAVFFIVLLVSKEIGFKHLIIIVGLWIVGALPYEYLIVKNMIQSGDVAGTVVSALFGDSWQEAVLNTSMSMRIVKENIMWIALNFATPNILLLFFGLGSLYKAGPRRSFSNIIIAVLVLFFVFAFRYTIVDRYAFFIPFYCVVSILIGVGVCVVIEKKPKTLAMAILLLSFLPVGAYVFAPQMAKVVGINSGRERMIPYRDDLSFFLRPWKTGYHGADRFAREALDIVEDRAVIYSDGTTVYPLLYAQEVKGMRRDVSIVSAHGSVDNLKDYDEDVIDELAKQRPIYVVTAKQGYCPVFLLDRFDFEQIGVLYKAVKKGF
ncbi:protein O-mannosyl-transferase family [Planctomycetota bacterium]